MNMRVETNPLCIWHLFSSSRQVLIFKVEVKLSDNTGTWLWFISKAAPGVLRKKYFLSLLKASAYIRISFKKKNQKKWFKSIKCVLIYCLLYKEMTGSEWADTLNCIKEKIACLLVLLRTPKFHTTTFIGSK